MAVFPYKLRPVPPSVCVLNPDGSVLGEHGDAIDLEELPHGYRVWCSYDTVRQLVTDGKGEALCWNGEEIRWRHRRYEDGWKRRHSDVNVIKLPFHDDEPERSLEALVRWRDWLSTYGASPIGTTGSASWSLLRATITRPLWLSVGQPPPLKQTLGGRQEIGPGGQGRFEGQLEQLDLPAAYASELGNLRYGGHWMHVPQGGPLGQRAPEWWAREERPVFVRAVVRLRGGGYGPLPRRPKRRVHGIRAALQGVSYPRSGRIQGVWTWQELAAAECNGAQIVRVLDTWVHLSEPGQRPFLPWWRAIEEGRRMGGLAGLLAKTTGNALWGRFCMDSSSHGERTIASRAGAGRSLNVRPFPFVGGLPAAHDLAETISGRTRARLYQMMEDAGGDLLSAHTDGVWVRGPMGEPEGWRRKETARRVDLLDPQVLRYWPRKSHGQQVPWVVFAGVPAAQADQAFADAWAASGLGYTREAAA